MTPTLIRIFKVRTLLLFIVGVTPPSPLTLWTDGIQW